MGRNLSPLSDSRATVGVTTNYTAQSGQLLLIDTTSAVLTVTLPDNPSVGDRINFIDAAGNCGTNKAVIARNGNKIANLAEDLDFDIRNTSLELLYTGPTYGWSILSN
jgi:hypothetical protein